MLGWKADQILNFYTVLYYTQVYFCLCYFHSPTLVKGFVHHEFSQMQYVLMDNLRLLNLPADNEGPKK